MEDIIKNITKYTEIYSGKKTIFEEGDMFKITIPLVKTQDETYDKIHDKTHDEIEKIIQFCKTEKDIYEIMRYLGYNGRTNFRRYHIKPLVEKGILKMTIPDKPTSGNQKYISNDLKGGK